MKAHIKITTRRFNSKNLLEDVESDGEIDITFPEDWDEEQKAIWLFHLERTLNESTVYRAHITVEE